MHEIRYDNKVNRFGFYLELMSDGLYLRRYLRGPNGSTTEDYDWRIFLAPHSCWGYPEKTVQELLDAVDPKGFISIVWYNDRIFPYTTQELLEIHMEIREQLIEQGIDPDTGKKLEDC